MENSQNSKENSAADKSQNEALSSTADSELDQLAEDLSSLEIIEERVPRVEITEIPNGHQITTTEADGTKTIETVQENGNKITIHVYNADGSFRSSSMQRSTSYSITQDDEDNISISSSHDMACIYDEDGNGIIVLPICGLTIEPTSGDSVTIDAIPHGSHRLNLRDVPRGRSFSRRRSNSRRRRSARRH